MSNSVHLKKFSSDELILDESETRTVLKFFWPQESVATRIDESLIVTDSVREFAQALLVEAVDASYQVGFIEAIVRSTANPTRGAVKVLKDFVKRAAKNWFKHARASDLQKVRIYDFIRNHLARAFRVKLNDHLNGVAQLDREKPLVALLTYAKRPAMAKVWG